MNKSNPLTYNRFLMSVKRSTFDQTQYLLDLYLQHCCIILVFFRAARRRRHKLDTEISLDFYLVLVFSNINYTLHMSWPGLSLLQRYPASLGDSTISWLISLMAGLSFVILRQIIQDYNLMGLVKSDGRYWVSLSKKLRT